LVGCGAASDLSSSGGGSSNLNFSSPYSEIDLAAPDQLPLPGSGDGEGGVAPGASFASEVGGENVTALLEQGQFNPNWGTTTHPDSARLAWATYWLDMTNQGEATELVLDWLAQPRPQDVWVGLANWETNRWVWRKLQVADTVTPPSAIDPFIRDEDMMLACTILLVGTQQVTLNEIGTNQGPGIPPPPNDELLNLNAHLGLNLDSLADYTPSTVFLDVFQTARDWIPQDVVGGPWDNGHAINVDSDGWVTSLDAGQAVATLMMTDDFGVYPTGQYICLYDGVGTIEFEAEASVAWSTPGRMGVDITPAGGSTRLRITATDPDDYIRNIRLILPGFENTYEDLIFHPDFLSSISAFDVLRFTKWGGIVESEVTTWSDRTTLNSFSQARQDGPNAGVSMERMIDLANKNLSDAWICIPHLADDDYVTNAAALIRDRLDPRLRVYVEYSNEIWNSQFMASDYCKAQGLALGLSTNDFEAQLRFYSQRSQEIFDIFTTAFTAAPDRLVRVAAGQGSNPWVGTTIMDWDGAQGMEDEATTSDRFDYYASAPYFGGYLGNLPQADTTRSMSVTDLLAACDADSLAVNGLGGSTETNALNAADRGISLIAYEGGQHLVGVGAAKDYNDLTDLFIDANRDMGMRDIYADDMRRWAASGGGLFVSFSHISNYSKHGSWGLLEAQDQDTNTAPKWLGLMDWVDEITAE
jgi:hypothetical protein